MRTPTYMYVRLPENHLPDSNNDSKRGDDQPTVKHDRRKNARCRHFIFSNVVCGEQKLEATESDDTAIHCRVKSEGEKFADDEM